MVLFSRCFSHSCQVQMLVIILFVIVIILFAFFLKLSQIDHFGFLEDGTFKQRYLLSDKYWQQPGGPILFYTGNEGDITWFCNNTVNIQVFSSVFVLRIILSLIQHLLFSL